MIRDGHRHVRPPVGVARSTPKPQVQPTLPSLRVSQWNQDGFVNVVENGPRTKVGHVDVDSIVAVAIWSRTITLIRDNKNSKVVLSSDGLREGEVSFPFYPLAVPQSELCWVVPTAAAVLEPLSLELDHCSCINSATSFIIWPVFRHALLQPTCITVSGSDPKLAFRVRVAFAKA